MDWSRLRRVSELGQSVWCDDLTRELVTSGRLRALVTEACVTGLSSNPTIFQRAIASDESYGLGAGAFPGSMRAEEIYEDIVVNDVRGAAEVLTGVYERTDGADGYASLEVPPALAYDMEATVAEARRLVGLVGRANVMVKVPATPAGVKAVRRLIAEGVSVDVTLIFGPQRYAEVVEAYVAGLEEALHAGRRLRHIACVASVFISRVDAAVARAVGALAGTVAKQAGEEARLQALTRMAGVANGHRTYEMFLESCKSPRFRALGAKGALPQRICWSSMAVKDPVLRDVQYVEQLITPESVVDVPLSLIDAFADHGHAVAVSLEDLKKSREVVDELSYLGVDFDAIGVELEAQGLAAFAASVSEALATIDRKRASERR